MVFWLLAGCSGYRFTQQENPLSQYGIQSLSIPMFYNYSNFASISGDFTTETYRLLSSFSGLKLRSGYDNTSDAILIGIIKSPEKSLMAMKPNNILPVKARAGNAVGANRQQFYLPSSTELNLSLQIIVIKKPTEEELTLLKSGIGDQIKGNSRVIFNELIPIRSQFTREILDKDLANGVNGTNVVATQNLGAERKTLRAMAEQAAISIRDTILYAF